MLVDLSGFTSLTETLLQRGKEGADELSHILNEIFAPMVKVVYQCGGHIPCFAGDSFAAVFPCEDCSSQTVAQLALQVRSLFEERDFQFGEFVIGLRIGLAAGVTEWGLVGSHNKQSFYFRGAPIDEAAECQQKARDREILLDPSFLAKFHGQGYTLKPVEAPYMLLEDNGNLTWKPPDGALIPEVSPQTLVRFFPKGIWEGNFEGEFRTVISIFLAFKGANTHDQMNSLATSLLEEVERYSGYFKEIEFGDKGGVMVILFGAPITFENVLERALEFVESVREDLLDKILDGALQYRIGMSMGTAFTGIIGGEERSQYAAVGNRVNLAARLMTYAAWGEVLVDSEVSKEEHFRFEPKGDIRYKGIKGTVPTFKFLGKDHDFQKKFSGRIFGRETEISRLLKAVEPLHHGKPAGLIKIFGEAGMGKSRLTYELRQQVVSDNLHWYYCPADEILRKPFNPFFYFLRDYFHQSPDESPNTNRRWFETQLKTLLQGLKKSQHPRAEWLADELRRLQSILGAQLGIIYPGSLWEQLDARGRYQNTLDAISQLFFAEACIQPVVVQLEDSHWLDDNSKDLMQELLRGLPNYNMLLLVTSRYNSDGSKPPFLRDHDSITSRGLPVLEIDLNMLSPEAVKVLAEETLGGSVHVEFLKMLLQTTSSNPFYLEQLLEYFNDQGMLKKKKGLWTVDNPNVSLADSVHAILTARIDSLPASAKEIVKAAAVIGQEFELAILNEVMKRNGSEFQTQNATHHLREQVKKVEEEQIWRTNRDLQYAFKHALLREAAYGMQMQTRLRQLHHAIAMAIEKLYADKLEERFVDLAFHYDQAGVYDKTCEFLHKAAEHAKLNYQNQKALEFFEKLLSKMEEVNESGKLRIETLLNKGKLLELVGDWEFSEQTYLRALDLAKGIENLSLLGQVNNHLGRLLTLKGLYSEAMDYLQVAAGIFESANDKAGISRVNGNLGNLYFRQGKYEEAKAYFSNSLLISQSLPLQVTDPQIVSNLALTHMNQGNYEEAIHLQQAQLQNCIEQVDKQGMASIYTYMGIVYLEKGDYDSAMESFQKGLDLSIELGSKQLRSVAIGNIGIINQRQGKYREAMTNFEEDLRLVEELGDKQGTAIALGLIGDLHSIQGRFFKAIEYLQKNLMLSEELNYQKGIAKAVNTLGDVFYYLGQYDRSLHFYDRAIEVTRDIGNKLVLGMSLVEKCGVLAAKGDKEKMYSVFQEAVGLAKELGNPDLIFQAKLVEAQVLTLQGKPEEAVDMLKGLLNAELAKDQEAAVWYGLFLADGQQEEFRTRALGLYEELFQNTPRFTYRQRIALLSGEEEFKPGLPPTRVG